MMARVLKSLGSQAAFVVHGAGGLDELSTIGPNRVTRLQGDRVETFSLDPQDLGLRRAELSDLRGGDPGENAAIACDILDGQPGARRDVVLLNASAALVAGGIAGDLSHGLNLAAESIDSGAARTRLDGLVAFTNSGGCAS
jgi:anthranilate phosphoribosyltransferase